MLTTWLIGFCDYDGTNKDQIVTKSDNHCLAHLVLGNSRTSVQAPGDQCGDQDEEAQETTETPTGFKI